MKLRALRYTLLLSILFGISFLLRASLPSVATGTWVAAGNMSAARSGACTVALNDGHLLISGGADANGPTATADLFSTTGSWSAAASMNSPRSHQSCAVLQDGRVLVAGGTTSGGGITNSAEIYDPSADSWSPAGLMNDARSGATASVLQDGRVLIAGGQNSGGASNTLEIFDPNSGNFSNAGTMSSPRQDHAAAVLSDGRVLIAGGSSDGTNALNTTDIYDPQAGSVTPGPAMSTPRAKATATTLLDGTVVVIGGSDGTADLASAEFFDPAANNFNAAGSLATARSKHSAFLLPNNNEVLVVGGQSAGTDLGSAELYIPWQKAFQATGAMTTPRSDAAGAALTKVDGRLLVAGGSSASAELYGFATVKTDAADYPPGSTVTITGSGWQPGETVTLTLVESPLIDTHGPYTTVADASGNISDSSFVTDLHDLNIRFYLTAVGSVSQAQTTFTDAKPNKISAVGAQSPNPVSAGNSATYSVTVSFNGNGDSCDAVLSTSGLPAGASASFAPVPGTNPANTITSTGGDVTTTLTVSTTAGMTPATTTFRITATGTGVACSGQTASTISGGGGGIAADPTLVVSKAASTTTFGAAPTPTYLGGNFTVSASNNSGGVITYSRVSGPCALVSGATFSSSGAGSCVVQADSATTTNYLASSAQQTVTIAKATPTITWSNPADITYGMALSATQLNATASVAGTFTYTPTSGTVLASGSNQNLHVDFTPTDTANYNNTSKDVK